MITPHLYGELSRPSHVRNSLRKRANISRENGQVTLQRHSRHSRRVQDLVSIRMTASISLIDYVDFSKTSLAISLLSIVFNPTAWNIIARNGRRFVIQIFVFSSLKHLLVEYRNRTITRLFGGNQYLGCYFLAVLIFSFGILRDSLSVV
jgi:hypothetical protein